MDWIIVLGIIFGGLALMMATGLPVAFCFLAVNIVGIIFLWGGSQGLVQLVYSMWFSISTFTYLPIVMFVLLGELVFRSGMAMRAIDTADKWLGRLPGRLGLLTVMVATIFSTMSGSTIPTTAMLGETLLPEMEKRGYSKIISIGTIMSSGSLAMMIPPSGPAVVWATIAEVSVGRILISGIIPGLIIAFFYAAYIIGRCWLQPALAPPYDVTTVPLSRKFSETAKYVLPLSLVVFMVTGLMFLGVAGPSEAAVMGVLGSLILAVIYRCLDMKVIKDSLIATVTLSGMIFLILATSQVFSQLLAFTGATRQFTVWVMSLSAHPIVVLLGMMFILFILGCFMSALPMMMITLPIFMPIVRTLGMDPVWFGLLFLINVEMGQTTPPFGVLLFTMKGVTPETSMTEIVKAGVPFLICDVLVMALVIIFPVLATWLPSIMIVNR